MKIFNAVKEYQTLCTPHIIKIIKQENTVKREKKGYRVLRNALILTVKAFITPVRVGDRNTETLILDCFIYTDKSALKGKINNFFT